MKKTIIANITCLLLISCARKIETTDDMRNYLNGKQFKADGWSYKGTYVKTEMNAYFTDQYIYMGSPSKTAKYLISKKPGDDGTRFTKEPFYFYITFNDERWKGLCEMKITADYKTISFDFPDGGTWLNYESDFDKFPGNSADATVTQAVSSATKEIPVPSHGTADDQRTQLILGKWKGTVDGKDLLISLDKMDAGNTVLGYAMLGDNPRNVRGTYMVDDENNIHLNLDEPGDKDGDGKFVLLMLFKEKTAAGNWKAYKESKEIKINLVKE